MVDVSVPWWPLTNCPYCGEPIAAGQSRLILREIYEWPESTVLKLSPEQAIAANCLAAMATDPREGLLRQRMRQLMNGESVK